MAAGRIEQAVAGGWVLCIPLPGGGEERLAFADHDQAAQGLALHGLHTALQAGDVAEAQRLVEVLQADDESLAELRELSLPEFVQMLRLSLEEGAADNGEVDQLASGNNATPSPDAHGTMISMNSTAAGTQSLRPDATLSLPAVKQEPEPAVKAEDGRSGAAAEAAPGAAAAAPTAVKAQAEPMQLDEQMLQQQDWDSMEVDEDAEGGSDYPGVTRVQPSGGGSAAALSWQVALLVRLDATGSPDAGAQPTEQLFQTATEIEAALASDLAQLWQEQHCGPQAFGAFGRKSHFNQTWYNNSATRYSLDAPLWGALSQLSTFSELQAYLVQLQACGFLAAAAEAYCDLQMPREPWPDPELASGCAAAEQPSNSPAQGADGGGGGPGGGRKRKAAWQPVGAQPAASPQQQNSQQLAPKQRQGEQQQQQQQGTSDGCSPGISPQGPSGAVQGGGSGRRCSSSDERLLKAAQFSGLSFVQYDKKWRAYIALLPPVGTGKQVFVIAHDEPLPCAVARDLAVFWRLEVLKQPSAKMSPAVLRERYAADAGLVQRLEAATSIEQLRTLLRELRDSGTLAQLAPKLRQQLQQQQAGEGQQGQPLSPPQRRRQPGPPPPLQQQQQQQLQLGMPEQPQQPAPEPPPAELPPQQPAADPGEAADQQLLRQGSLQQKREAVQVRMDRLREQAAREAEQGGSLPSQQQGGPLLTQPAEQGQQEGPPQQQGQASAQQPVEQGQASAQQPVQGQAQVQPAEQEQQAQQQVVQGQARVQQPMPARDRHDAPQGQLEEQRQQAQPPVGQGQQPLGPQAVQQPAAKPSPAAPTAQAAAQQSSPAAQPAVEKRESSQSLQLFFRDGTEQPLEVRQQQQQQGRQEQRGSQPQQGPSASGQPPQRQQQHVQQNQRPSGLVGRSPSRSADNRPGSRQEERQQPPQQHHHQKPHHQHQQRQYPQHDRQAWQKEQQRLQWRRAEGRPAMPSSPRGGAGGWHQAPLAAQPVPVFVPGPVLVPMDLATASMAARHYQQQQLAAMSAQQQAAAAWPQQMAPPHMAAASAQQAGQAAMFNAQQQQYAAAMHAAAGMQPLGSGSGMALLPPHAYGWPGA